MKKRHKRILLNVFAFSALAFAIYFSLFYKEKPFERPQQVQASQR